ncbi:hypothetical protein [Variovorax sp. YR566]|uniref:hypothetical protein n=1 Tax=Variovorax sp. YR566 TaxID=3450237 RepID=UPI003F81D07D
MDTQTARRVDAEIAKLMMEAEKYGDERRKLQAEADKLNAEGNKLRAEAVKVTREILYPLFIGTGLMGAGAALFSALGKLFP